MEYQFNEKIDTVEPRFTHLPDPDLPCTLIYRAP